jgi:hypothetical protein
MRFGLVPVIDKDVLPVGWERGNLHAESDWRRAGRWRLDLGLIGTTLGRCCAPYNEPSLPSALVVHLIIAGSAGSGQLLHFFGGSPSYVRSRRELHLSVSLPYKGIKSLDAEAQWKRLCNAILRSAREAERTLEVPRTVSLVLLTSRLKEVLAQVQPREVTARAAA